MCSYNPSLNYYRANRGADCETWFAHELENIAVAVEAKYNNISPIQLDVASFKASEKKSVIYVKLIF